MADVAPTGQKLPAAHTPEQRLIDRPALAPYTPPPHAVHAATAPSENEPAAHDTQRAPIEN